MRPGRLPILSSARRLSRPTMARSPLLVLLATATALVPPPTTRRAPRTVVNSDPMDKLKNLEVPPAAKDALDSLKNSAGNLDLDGAKSFASANLDVLKGSGDRAVVDVAAAGACGLLFGGLYGAVVFALAWCAAAPKTAAYSRPADDYTSCVETAVPGAVVAALLGMVLTFKIFNPVADVFAALFLTVFVAGARGGKLYLDTKTPPAVDDLTKVDVGNLKWPEL